MSSSSLPFASNRSTLSNAAIETEERMLAMVVEDLQRTINSSRWSNSERMTDLDSDEEGFRPTVELDDLSLEELQRQIQHIQMFNASIRKECALYDSFIHRIGGQVPAADDLPQQSLTLEQKFLISTSELKDVRDEIETTKDTSEKYLEQLRSLREETEIRIAEMRKEAYEFRRDIVAGAVNPRTKKIIAERVIRYFEDKIKTKDNLIEKLKLKNLTLKNQCTKIEGQLQHKEDMGEVFLPIDFDQLKIENQQYLEKIEERNAELLNLKVTAGHTLRVLSNYKKKLHNLGVEQNKLGQEIRVKEENLGRVVVEQEAAENRNEKLKQQLEEYRVPAVLEYVGINAELNTIEKKIKDWERKVEIAQMAYKKSREKPRSVQQTQTQCTATTE
ncbi:hypothetical protein PROFUN_08695 [Planoprotostelium fungivorum]|uniref:Cilia- and flagella-associated protein 263 n=1 Tax=Planoprotostelium fungivorum TaxID=1890364 RepID=A0A2P6MQT6_9EUKA|nr:hypothetical protein PROFUN_08695 [Planoprotostelium fungivorum]